MNHIGRKYKYWNCPQIFVLKEIEGWVYRFECGHWCTDSVFEDLVYVKKGIANYLNKQLTLEF